MTDPLSPTPLSEAEQRLIAAYRARGTVVPLLDIIESLAGRLSPGVAEPGTHPFCPLCGRISICASCGHTMASHEPDCEVCGCVTPTASTPEAPDPKPAERDASWCEVGHTFGFGHAAHEMFAPEPGVAEPPAEDPHPEDFCNACGRPNIVWWVDSDEWNAATSRGDILCPVCFVEKWTEATGRDRILWELRIDPRSTDAPEPPPVAEGVVLLDGKQWRVEAVPCPWSKDGGPVHYRLAPVLPDPQEES